MRWFRRKVRAWAGVDDVAEIIAKSVSENAEDIKAIRGEIGSETTDPWTLSTTLSTYLFADDKSINGRLRGLKSQQIQIPITDKRGEPQHKSVGINLPKVVQLLIDNSDIDITYANGKLTAWEKE